MTEKRLYALDDEHVEALTGAAGNWARTLRMNNREAIREDHAITALTPLDTDNTIEQIAIAIAAECEQEWGILSPEGKEDYRELARAALNALLGGEQ